MNDKIFLVVLVARFRTISFQDPFSLFGGINCTFKP